MNAKGIIITICLGILGFILFNNLINWLMYTPKYLHLYGRVDPRIKLEAWTVNYTDKKQGSECCYYSFDTGEYEPKLRKKKTEIVINNDGTYSILIPINFIRIKRACRWDDMSIGINLFYKEKKAITNIEIVFFDNIDYYKEYQKEYNLRKPLKKVLNIIGKVEYIKSNFPVDYGKIYELCSFDDSALPENSYNLYYYIIPEDIDVVECEMNITDIRFINTIKDAMKE